MASLQPSSRAPSGHVADSDWATDKETRKSISMHYVRRKRAQSHGTASSKMVLRRLKTKQKHVPASTCTKKDVYLYCLLSGLDVSIHKPVEVSWSKPSCFKPTAERSCCMGEYEYPSKCVKFPFCNFFSIAFCVGTVLSCIHVVYVCAAIFSLNPGVGFTLRWELVERTEAVPSAPAHRRPRLVNVS
jgi:hypothetical protein